MSEPTITDPMIKGVQHTISIDYDNCYELHREFFDMMARGLQACGHRVGIITGMREKDVYNNEDLKTKMISQLGFKPDFVHMWGQTETIGNGSLWKAQKMDDENTLMHFDDDAIGIKHFTSRQVIKTIPNHELERLQGHKDTGGAMA
jgi:hypothetical protein